MRIMPTKRAKYVLLIMLVSLLFKLWLSSTSPYLNDWDERYHALVAKHMAMSNDFLKPVLYKNPVVAYDPADWSKNHVWLHKQPAPLWVMALSIKTFGVGVHAIRLPSILLATLAIYFIFYLGSQMFGSDVGLIAAALFSINGLTNLLSTGKVATDHIDVFFMFFVLVAIFFAFKHYQKPATVLLVLSGFFTGLAVLTKWLPAYTVFLVFVYLHYNKHDFDRFIKNCLVFLLSSVSVWLPWQLYAYHQYPEEFLLTQQHNMLHITQYLDGHVNGFAYFIFKTPYLYGEICFLAVVLAFFFLKGSEKKYATSLLIWVLVPLVFFSIVKTKMQGYTFFTAPAWLILNSFTLLYCYDQIRTRRFGKQYALLFLLVANISPMIRFVESIQFHRILSCCEERSYNFELNKNTVIFGSKHPINDMFFYDITASYEAIPAPETIDSLREAGYEIVLLEK